MQPDKRDEIVRRVIRSVENDDSVASNAGARMKKKAVGSLLTKIARRQPVSSPELRETMRKAEEFLDSQPRLTEEQLNRRMGY